MFPKIVYALPLALLFCTPIFAFSLFKQPPPFIIFYPNDINGGSYWLEYLKVNTLDANSLVCDYNVTGDINASGDVNISGNLSVTGNSFLHNTLVFDLNAVNIGFTGFIFGDGSKLTGIASSDANAELDGGFAASVYLVSQYWDGGGA